MNSPRPLVSVVCPAFQEEAVLPFFHGELAGVLDSLDENYRFEIVYVDDGSQDGTLACLRQLARQDSRVRFLSLSRNFGHQAALTAGLEHAVGEAVVCMDSDLQHPPRVLPMILDQWQNGHDVVLTIREEDDRLGLFKRYSSRLFYGVMALLSTTDVRVSAADFRLLSRTALRAFLQFREQHRFVRGMVQWLGFRQTEVTFQPDSRRAGRSKYTLRRMLRLAGDGLFSFSNLPLRLPFVVGLLTWALGLFHVLAYCLCVLLGRQPLDFAQHYQIVMLQFIGGGILCGLGTLGEYLGRVYDEVKRRPLYLVKEAFPVEDAALSKSHDGGPSRREAA